MALYNYKVINEKGEEKMDLANLLHKKRLPLSSIILVMLITAAIPIATASPETRVYVEPPTSVANPGQIVTVTIEVQEVTGLFAWEFFLSWDSEILYTNDTLVTEGDFLNQGVPYPTTFVKDVTLFNMQVSCLLQIPVAVDGSGTLAEIQFEVRGTGQNILELYDTALRDIGGIPIVHTSDSGVFYTTYPRAEFTFSPSPESPPDFRNPVVDEVVTFNASESYDPDGTIVSYDWDFDDGTSDSGEIVTHAYTAPGTYAIILTVTDDEAKTDTYQKSATVELRDIAIVSLESPSAVWPGDTAFIDVTVANEGSIGEYFNLTVHYDDTPIWYNKTIGWKAYTLYDRDEQGNPRDPLGSGKNITITFTWNTTGVAEGTHTIRANASRVNSSGDEFLPLEYDPADNKKTAPIFIGYPRDANLVKRSAWPAHRHFDQSRYGQYNTLYGKVANRGMGDVLVKVLFTIYDEVGQKLEDVSTAEYPLTVAEGEVILSVDFDTYAHETSTKYYVDAQCWFDSDLDGTLESAGAKIKSFSFAVVP